MYSRLVTAASRKTAGSTWRNLSGRRNSEPPDVLHSTADGTVLVSDQRRLIVRVGRRRHVQRSDHLRTLGVCPLESMCGQLLAHQLVERLVEHDGERQQGPTGGGLLK